MKNSLSIEKWPSPKLRCSGISIVEMMVSISIMAIVFVILIFSQYQSNQLAAQARNISSAKVQLRNLVDRFQTASIDDPLLYTTKGYTSDSNLGLTDPTATVYPAVASMPGVQVVLYDADPTAVLQGRQDASYLLATMERNVTAISGAVDPTTGRVTSTSALLSATFRITFRSLSAATNAAGQVVSLNTVLTMSTNRAIP